MGVMIEGTYRAQDPDPQTDDAGRFRRSASTIRNWITLDGAPGPTGTGGYAAEPGRYHLYLAWNCPWAHRALLARLLLGLQEHISVSFAAPRRTDDGWIFHDNGSYVDPLLGVAALHEVYARASMPYTGRVTVPVLWDRQAGDIVSNESADIVRMLNMAFKGNLDLYPEELRESIDSWNADIYSNVNNGVYKAGFARTQDAYDEAVLAVFDALDRIDRQLSETRFLTGDRFTEADLRLFPTLARFDVAYHYAFKCNIRRLQDYEYLWPYARAIYQMPGVAGTVRFDIYKQGYFSPSPLRNPLGIVPAGPDVDWGLPHGLG